MLMHTIPGPSSNWTRSIQFKAYFSENVWPTMIIDYLHSRFVHTVHIGPLCEQVLLLYFVYLGCYVVWLHHCVWTSLVCCIWTATSQEASCKRLPTQRSVASSLCIVSCVQFIKYFSEIVCIFTRSLIAWFWWLWHCKPITSLITSIMSSFAWHYAVSLA